MVIAEVAVPAGKKREAAVSGEEALEPRGKHPVLATAKPAQAVLVQRLLPPVAVQNDR